MGRPHTIVAMISPWKDKSAQKAKGNDRLTGSIVKWAAPFWRIHDCCHTQRVNACWQHFLQYLYTRFPLLCYGHSFLQTRIMLIWISSVRMTYLWTPLAILSIGSRMTLRWTNMGKNPSSINVVVILVTASPRRLGVTFSWFLGVTETLPSKVMFCIAFYHMQNTFNIWSLATCKTLLKIVGRTMIGW